MQKSETLRNITITHSVTAKGKKIFISVEYNFSCVHCTVEDPCYGLNPTTQTCICVTEEEVYKAVPRGARPPPSVNEVTRPKEKGHLLVGGSEGTGDE